MCLARPINYTTTTTTRPFSLKQQKGAIETHAAGTIR
jgi:hypothetical protein